MSRSRPPVLVLDGFWRKSLPVIRGLHAEGWEVWVGEETSTAPALHSHLPERRFVYPSPRRNPDQFSGWLQRLTDTRPDLLVLPLEDPTITVLLSRPDVFRDLRIPIRSSSLFSRLSDTLHVLKIARENEIFAIPETARVPAGSRRIHPFHGDPRAIADGQWVLKPRAGRGAIGVRYGRGRRQLAAALSERKSCRREHLLQRNIRGGTGYGVSAFIGREGALCTGMVHERLREWPVTGGASTLRRTVVNRDLRERGIHFLRNCNWTGVGQVELRKEENTGIYYLMEVNARFWGSLALGLASGLNFPHYLCMDLIGERPTLPDDYREGVHARWFLPGDLMNTAVRWADLLAGRLTNGTEAANGGDAPSPVSTDGEKGDRDRLVYDLLRLEDPGPVIARVASFVSYFFNPTYRRWDELIR